MAVPRLIRFILLAVWGMAGIVRAEESSVFGREDNSQAGLIGILYDLKQTQKRQPSRVGPQDYSRVLDEFLAQDWSESVLNRYFRSTRPLYATQIFMPLMSAGLAPKAFELDKVMKPAAWVVVYKGQVSPPEDGTYRFVGYADDVIGVAINGKTVLVGGRPDTTNYLKTWKSSEKDMPKAANGRFIFGDWVELKKDEPVDIDLFVGERPGGSFCAFLAYEKQGAVYPESKGQKVYPLFQLAPQSVPDLPVNQAPPLSTDSAPWKGYQ